jgi:hypothetical protein
MDCARSLDTIWALTQNEELHTVEIIDEKAWRRRESNPGPEVIHWGVYERSRCFDSRRMTPNDRLLPTLRQPIYFAIQPAGVLGASPI